jgi:hypothetical protein
MASANMLVLLIVATIVGAVTGTVLGGAIEPIALAITAGFAGVIVASVVRNTIMVRLASAGPDDSGLPLLVIVYSSVASLGGSLTAYEITRSLVDLPHGLLGALAGAFFVLT